MKLSRMCAEKSLFCLSTTAGPVFCKNLTNGCRIKKPNPYDKTTVDEFANMFDFYGDTSYFSFSSYLSVG